MLVRTSAERGNAGGRDPGVIMIAASALVHDDRKRAAEDDEAPFRRQE